MRRVPLLFAMLVACGGSEVSKPAPADSPELLPAADPVAESARAVPAPEPTPPDDGPGFGVGDIAPTFSLPDDTGKPIGLDDFRDQRAVLLAFYPQDFTGG